MSADDGLVVRLDPWTGPWPDDDKDANLKADVALYSKVDPLRTVRGLSSSTGIPEGAIVRWVLARWASEGCETMTPAGLSRSRVSRTGRSMWMGAGSRSERGSRRRWLKPEARRLHREPRRSERRRTLSKARTWLTEASSMILRSESAGSRKGAEEGSVRDLSIEAAVVLPEWAGPWRARTG